MGEDDATFYLREVGRTDDAAIDLGEAALHLATFRRPRVSLARYREHLAALAGDVAEALGPEPEAPAAALTRRVEALKAALIDKNGYRGDRLTYDDLQNANLMRVIDRRRGLPVALGILYLHAARAQGWECVGLSFPGHFLVRLSDGPERLILDPFHGGKVCDAAGLRDLLKAMAGQEVELSPEHYAPAADRDVLLRLQNNIKSRLLQAGRGEEAVKIVETMLLLAPDLADLWREAGALHAQLGNIRAAIKALDEFVARAPQGAARHQGAAMLQQLKSKLN